MSAEAGDVCAVLVGAARMVKGRWTQLVKGVAADNTSAASDRVVAIAVLSQLVRSAEVLDRTARALALCSLMPMLS